MTPETKTVEQNGPAKAAEPLGPVVVVVIGSCMTADKVIGVKLAVVSDPKAGHFAMGVRELVFGKDVRKQLRGKPGSMYTIPMNAAFTTMRASAAKWYGWWPHESQRVEWAAEDAAFLASIEADKERKKMEKLSPMVLALAPIRRAYAKSSHAKREQLLALVVAYIVGVYRDGER